MMGQHLWSALGADLVIIGVSSAQNGAGLPTASLEPGGLDAALSRVGPPLFLLDLRATPSDLHRCRNSISRVILAAYGNHNQRNHP
jgi:hypothetical protein